MAKEVVIVSALRTAIGNFSGSLSTLPAHKLGEAIIRETLAKTGVKGDDISEVILGQVLNAAHGQNPPRQAVINAGIPNTTPAWGVSQVCGSGLRAVALGFQSIMQGDSDIIIAGGQESMSQAAHAAFLRTGIKMGDGKLVDTMIKDGLWDAFNDYHMGNTAENLAKKFSISRAEQDEFSALSQQKAEAAIKGGKFKDEIIPITIKDKKGDIVFDTDEFPRAGTTAETLGKLRPAFDKEGTVTAGNASGINDGAAAVMLMSKEEANKRGLEILGTIRSWAHAGVEPSIMGIGPVYATRKALAKAGWDIKDLDLIEANEAFAAQSISVNKELGWDASKINVNGGAIALGHPIGASGARVFVTLLHEMKKRGSKKGLATLCIGGGMGIALTVER